MFLRRVFNMLFGIDYDIMNNEPDVNANDVNENDVNENCVNENDINENDRERYDYYVYATDNSGSTDGSKIFNAKGLQTLKDFKSIVDNMKRNSEAPLKIVYLHWATECFEVSEKDVRIRYMNRHGRGGGTKPASFIQWIQSNVPVHSANLQLLYIVTDGEISQDSVRDSDAILAKKSFVFDHVIFQAINAHVEDIDMSVASMFLRHSKCRLYRNGELQYNVDLTQQFNYDDVTLNNYFEKKNELASYIKLKFLALPVTDSTVLAEIDKLKNLRSKLLKEYEKMTKPLPSTYGGFESKNRDVFVDAFKQSNYYKMLYVRENRSFNEDVDKLVSTLINYLHNENKSFAFDSLRVTNYYLAAGAHYDDGDFENFYLDMCEYENVKKIDFPDCLLDIESGVPALLLTRTDLLKSLGNNALTKFKQYNECPLYYLKNDEIRRSIEYYYNLESFQMLLEHNIRISPRTRKNFSGALVPLPEFDHYNDWVISMTYFNGKCIPYNKGLMYYVLYKHLLNAEYIDDINVIEYFRQYVVHRIEQTKCPMALTHLPLEPTMTVSLPAALWYCVDISTQLFGRDPIFFTKEKLRMYAHFVDDMLAILRWCSYTDLDVAAITERAELFKTINALKRRGQRSAKLLYILERVFETHDGFLVHKLKNKRAIKMLNYLSIDHTQMIDEQLLERSVDLNDHVLFYALVNEDMALTYNPIVVETMRPKFSYNSTTSYYDLLLRASCSVSANADNDIEIKPNTQGLNIHKILSLYKMYIMFVEQYEYYPTLIAFKEFVRKRCLENNDDKIGIVSENTPIHVEIVHGHFTEAVHFAGDIDAKEFLRRTRNSVNRVNRIMIERHNRIGKKLAEKYVRVAERRVNLM
ncbi:p94 [Agrotis segetum nucleopolyhedrovirus B]|uniref:p94 n=1 Tax=Agrotis segetum nucleopolyhedrovirus B TaxID=1580580 RepID=A0A0A7KVE2_9ABAC|nr:p94 [Agrotis segetum nucleopolyhedrovirus B]AIZ48660.1 p94 [Agrotis segetum nucleopolyhedrovirus B]